MGILALVLVACGSDGGSPPGAVDAGQTLTDSSTADAPPADAQPGVGEPPELQGITLLHNQVRQMVQTSPPLPALEWDASLAATAAAWVAQCQNTDGNSILDHNDGRSQGHPFYVGENIYASSGTATAMGAVSSWAAEKPRYNPDTGACSGTCGHYTQIVWRTTRKVGCARGSCPNIQFGSTIVCNYGPGGNTGGKAY